MDRDRLTEPSIPEIWFEPADPRRLGVLLRRMIGALACTVAVVSVLLVLTLSNRIADSERFEDRQLAAALARVPADTRSELAAAAGREAMLVDIPDKDGVLTEVELTVIVAREVPDALTQRWLDTVALRAARGNTEWFESVGPSDQVWWHTTAPISEEQTLVIYRPKSRALAMAAVLTRWIVAVDAVVAVGLFLIWLVLRRRVEASTNTLLEAVEELRVRGEIRSSVRRQLDNIPERPIELKRVARAVTDIEVDIRSAFDEIDALLRGAEALGGSLDPSHVLATSLEHLEHLLGAERSAIVQLDHRRKTWTVLAIHGHDDEYLAALTDQRYEESLPAVRASREHIPVQISDTESEFVAPSLRARARKFGYRSVLSVPLPSGLEAPTVLILQKSKPYTYSHYEIELSVSFASIAAAALRNAELFARTDQSLSEQTSRLSAIIESVDDGLLVEGSDGTLFYANSTVTALADADDAVSPVVPGETASSDLVESILSRAPAPADASAELDRVRGGSDDAWCEIDLNTAESATRTWRVRNFTVTDAQEREIGRGLVWTDVTRDRELDRMKSGLLATVSHEFRTPLALIKGYATTLLADDVEWAESDRYEFLELVANEADRLTSLVQRLLDMRRIDAGLVDLQVVPIELDSLISAAVVAVGPPGDRIEVEPVPKYLVMADEARIVTALRNLMDNACKYSRPDSPVTVQIETMMPTANSRGHNEADSEDHQVEIRVADRGPGIAETSKANVFDMFVRGDHGLDAVHGGTGLGLAIARGFVTAHGGRLWVQDRTGGGSVFVMSLPLTHEQSAVSDPRSPAPA